MTTLRVRVLVAAALFFASLALAPCSEALQPWMVATNPPGLRARELLSVMNRSEVLHLLHGNNTMFPYVGSITGNRRLNIPELRANDGSNGFRDGNLKPGSPGSSTQFPSLL